MNIVALIGNVAADPELRHTAAGRAVCNFRLAVSRPGADTADFFTVICWERQAEVADQYLSIGRRVAVEGRLHHTAKPSERRGSVEIVAHRILLLGAGSRTLDAGTHREVEASCV
jgi:single-strand DNA-binding protein